MCCSETCSRVGSAPVSVHSRLKRGCSLLTFPFTSVCISLRRSKKKVGIEIEWVVSDTYKWTNTTVSVYFPSVCESTGCESKFSGFRKYYKYGLDSSYRLVLSIYTPGPEPFPLLELSPVLPFLDAL
jgi:hypothetical protein